MNKHNHNDHIEIIGIMNMSSHKRVQLVLWCKVCGAYANQLEGSNARVAQAKWSLPTREWKHDKQLKGETA